VDDLQESKTFCPVTGFRVISKPSWAYEGKTGGFKVTVTLIGERILHIRARGYVSYDDQVKSIHLQDYIAKRAIGEKESFIQVQDWEDLTGASNDARQYYIDYLKDNDRVMGVIFCNTSFMFRMSIQLGKRLNLVPFPLHIADDYTQALKTAQIVLEKWTPKENPLPFILDEGGLDSSACRITGLEIIRKPGWADIKLDNGYFCNIRLIGERIINISLSGNITGQGTLRLLEVHNEFIDAMGLSNKKYVEIREYSRIQGIPPKKSRLELLRFIRQESRNNRMVGFWLYNVPVQLKSKYHIGLKFEDNKIPVRVVNTYKEAITDAVLVLREHSIQVDAFDFSKQRFFKNDWKLEKQGYQVIFEIIGDDIIYSEPHGVLKEEYVDDLFDLYKKVIKEAGFEKDKQYFRILNWENFERSTWRARKKYIQKIREINKLYPSSLSVVFGMNSLMSLMINVSKPFFPFVTFAVKDIHCAMEIIEQEHGFLKYKKKEIEDRGHDFEFNAKMDKYRNQLLKYMGSLDWDKKGINGRNIEDSHPFREVFDALAIIKNDLDVVFEERNEAETRLRQSEEKYRNILENIDDGYYEVDLKGNFLFFNETLVKLLGYSKSEFSLMNYKQILDKKKAKNILHAFQRVYNTGQPETNFGYEMISKDGKALYGEISISMIYDNDGNSTGFRGVVRDRTEKKALEDELIRHRDNLEKMIAMRTRELEEETIQKNYIKKINTSIFNISTAVNATHSLDELYHLIHRYLNDIIEMPNFYIGIYDQEKDMIKIPYNTDHYDGKVTELCCISKNRSLASEVVVTRKPLLLRKQDLIKRSKQNKVIGHVPENWLGVPLLSQDKIIGVMAIQNYTDQDYFTDQDLEILISVSNQVALAIERQQSLDDLHEREEKYRKLIETTSAGYWQVDENDRTIEVNQALCDMIGYEEHEIIGKTPVGFFENQLKKEYKKLLEQSSQTPDRSYEITFVKKNKDLLYSKVDATSMFDENGSFKGSFAFITDITGRIKSQHELHKAKEKAEQASKTIKTIMENLQAGVVLINANTHIIELVNRAAANMFGSSSEKIINRKCHRFLCPQQEGDCPITDLKVKVDNSERYMLNIHGGKIPILKTVNTVVLNGEKFLLESFVDITDQKKAKQSLIDETRRANKMALAAEAANKAKSEFLTNMSHEIRTPINGVIGMAEILMDSSLDKDQKTFVQTISSEADSLLGIINEILDFSKIEAGKMELEEIRFDPRKMFEDIADVLSIRADKKRLEFFSFLDTDIPPRLKGDPGRLRQIIMNLAGNALKFTNKGEIFISGKKIRQTNKHVTVRFEVKDTGIGIPLEKQKAVFESFAQADGSTTRKYGGTGLGTTISKQLVELMGGQIGLESRKGRGTKFWFTVNFKKAESKAHDDGPANIDLKELSVLVVDSNKTHQYIISRYLISFGCEPILARGSKDAFNILENDGQGEKIDLILSGFNLLKKDGFEFAEHIRKIKAYETIPIIMLTSMGTIGDGRRCRQIGINGYLSRPVRKKELQTTIAWVLGLIDMPPDKERHLITKHSIEESVNKDIKILVAEDYPTNQKIAVRHLNRAGFNVVLAKNGVKAVSMFKKTQFDLILMDIQMPEMDGYEATKEIRQIEHHISKSMSKILRTPVIAMTAHAMKGNREKCIQADMDDYLAKPLKRKDLIHMVEKWTSLKERQADSILQIEKNTGETIESQGCGEKVNLPIDMKRAIEEFDNDEDFFNEVLKGFLEHLNEQLDLIRTAIDTGDFETIEKQGHSIKGGAANLTAIDLSNAAFCLEKAGKEQSKDQMEDIMSRLESAYENLCKYVKLNGES